MPGSIRRGRGYRIDVRCAAGFRGAQILRSRPRAAGFGSESDGTESESDGADSDSDGKESEMDGTDSDFDGMEPESEDAPSGERRAGLALDGCWAARERAGGEGEGGGGRE
jgi:hypothetical protein